MNIPIPLWLTRAWEAFVEWGNVVVWKRQSLVVVRIDLLMAAAFFVSVSWYGLLYGWLGAFKGGATFLVIAALALFVRRS